MSVEISPKEVKRLRDAFFEKLKKDGVQGVVSVSVGGDNGKIALIIDVSRNYCNNAPKMFKGHTVLVEYFGDASVF